MTNYLAATCEKARAGWPCDPGMEKLRDNYVRAGSPDEKRRIAEEVQIYNTKVVTHIPLGEWFRVGAVRTDVEMLTPLPPVTVFWGIGKT